jgi:biopolymer transport protein ExbD
MSAPAPLGAAGGGALEGRLAGQGRARRGFSLTPLADIMFQLLIFFMLSSSLAPYALLPLSSPASATATAPEAPDRPAPQADTALPAQVIWHLERGTLRAGAERIPLEALPAALDALRADGIDDIVVFVTAEARAQDIADLLEPVRRAGLARLQLIGG